MLRIVRGSPTAEELAALVTVVTVAANSGGVPAPARSTWLELSRPGAFGARLPVRRDRRGWRASALPH